MQITNIQNIIKNNFKYKNNPIKFGTKYNPNTQKTDVVELSKKFELNPDDVAIFKKYHRGKLEFNPDVLMQRGQRLFIKHKDSYIPYGAHLDEYNAKGELIRHTSYNNGIKFIVDSYKNGELIQEDRYEDVFSFSPYQTKRTSVRKFNGFDKSGTKKNLTFSISRNYGKNWINHPEIELKKENLMVQFVAPSDEKDGFIRVTDKTLETNFLQIREDGIKTEYMSNPRIVLFGLKELKETIQNKEFAADFGFNNKFNYELDKSIEILSSKFNED